ncbi:MAG: serine/threonine protein kinase [Labilithrix sp.]|nr:serine/threonine protein kinase [Labilithrix sp.]MCW5831721.1 serine/threonine protein kinase [Labilithrix sp.]
MIGRTLEGRYTILTRLGSGSMGTVYRAKQHAMGREVAIKILRGDRAIDDTAKARFMREARANSLLASPNTVTVFDFGQSESGEFYLAMELLEGESLGQRLTRVGRLPIPLAVDAARQALRSLSEAHAKGIIHRDLKPDNLFFARMLTSAAGSAQGDAHEEIVKVLDFGIAKLIRDSDEPMGVVETQAGTVFGTPRYMSPEQAQGKPLDARTDLYSLGVIVYQMLTGRPPFTDNDAVVVMARHIKSVPKRPNEVAPDANVPKELEDVVMRALSKDPADRQASADVFAGELLAALEAQGAMTSGVRASITNAAGIRVPDSMRPPAISLPAAPATKRTVGGLPLPLVAAALPVIILVAAAGVYLGLRSGKPPAPVVEPSSRAAAAASAPATTGEGPRKDGAEPGATIELTETDEPPTVTPDSLPKAQPIATGAPRPAHGKGGRATKGAATKPTSNAPAQPSSTSNYGVFE